MREGAGPPAPPEGAVSSAPPEGAVSSAPPEGAVSSALFERARKVIPGGVNSPVRSFRSVGGHPYFVARGEGAYVWDADGNRLLDFVQSYGASILGHAHPAVIRAVGAAGIGGTTFGAPTEGEVLLAEAICARVDGCQQVRLVSSGTESGHERGPGGPRVHRPVPDRQVRRLLPRPLRRPAGRRRQRSGHPRPPRLGGRAGRARWPTRWWPPTTGSPSWTTRWPASSWKRWPPTWAWWPRRRDSSRGCGPPATGPVPC